MTLPPGVQQQADRARSSWDDLARTPAGRLVRGVVAALVVAALLPVALTLVLPGSRPVGVLLYGGVIGCLYGLIAVGLVLVHRANRVVNFAQAGLGAVPAVLALLLLADKGVPYVLVLPVLVLGALALGALVEITLIRRFATAPRLVLAVVTIGVAQLLAYVEFNVPKWVSGDVLPPSTFPTPFSGVRVELGGAVFSGDAFLAVAVSAGAVAGLAVFLRRTRLGTAVRACAENPDRAALLGIPVHRVWMTVWMLAALLSALGIFLRAPLVGLPIGTITGPAILLPALAAAVIARMEKLPVAFGAGIALGVVDQAVFYSTRDSRLSQAVVLPVVLAALLLQRRAFSRAKEQADASYRAVHEPRAVPAVLRPLREVVLARRAVAVVVAAVAVGLPFLVGPLYRNDASLVLVYALLGLSLVVLTGWAGQISLGQVGFLGIGAAVAGGLAADAQADFFLSVGAAGLVGAAVAVLVGLPALRMPGLYLAVTTLAFAAAMSSFVLNRDYFGWLLPEPENPVLRPVLYGRVDTADDLAFYYLCLAFLVAGVLSLRAVRASRAGRVLMAVRDNPRAAQAYGVGLARARLTAFAFSGFLAAVAGALFAYQQGAVDSGAFPVTGSLAVFAMVVVGGLSRPMGAVLGAAYLVGLERVPGLRDVELVQLLTTGVGLVLLLLLLPGGLTAAVLEVRDKYLRWVAARHGIAVPSLTADALVEEPSAVPAQRAAETAGSAP
ncbi:MAG TPA: ABC transporter permease [Mycobacteriales bacterium]|nr:ABC transporter permease [Mycobacteriales bacterium]